MVSKSLNGYKSHSLTRPSQKNDAKDKTNDVLVDR